MTDDGRDATLTPSQVIGIAATTADAAPGPPVRSSGTLPVRYVPGVQLGAGGMGEVVLATDAQIGREVAIKRMRVAPNPSTIARFVREAKIQGRLDHPAIVPVHELANDANGQPFFVMKRLTGTTLADILAANSRPRAKLLRAFADVCLAIEFAHSRGVIHRDLKPANIMLGDFGEVYVLDWGVARVLGETEDPEPIGADTVSGPGGTEAGTEVGAILGTPGYIAPETLRGEPIDTRADVFALGCLLFEILAGEPLLPRGRAALAVAFESVDARPSQRAPARDIPPELDSACSDATRFDRSARPTARGLAECIERYLDGDRDLAQRRTLAAVHLAAAREALARSDGEADRATAMREAGRAIALDPRSTDAAELVGRLVLEPPNVVPREVDEHVDDVEEATARAKANVMGVVLGSFVMFVPALLWMGVRSQGMVWLYLSLTIANLSFVMVGVKMSRRVSARLMHLAMIPHALVIALVAVIFPPILIAPGLAAGTVGVLLSDIRLNWYYISGLMLAAILVPWGLQIAGVLPATMSALGGELTMTSPAVLIRAPHFHVVLITYVVLLVAMTSLTARRLGLSHRAALRRLETQAWHLRQLVG